MSSVAVISAVVSAGAGIYSANKAAKSASANKLPADVYNAYGEPNTPASGAIASRDNIFTGLNSAGFQDATAGASQSYIQALMQAAHNPQLGQAQAYNSDVLNGKYLNSPQVKGYADQAYNSIIGQGANQDARIQAQFANNGLGFSTGMQQAQRANKAATAGQAATTRAGILSSNYQGERQLQQGAVGNELSLNSAAPSYLSQINGALFAPLSSQAGLTTQLLGNPVQSPQPTYIQNPTGADALAAGTSTATGLYSLFNSLKGKFGGGSTGNTTGSGTTVGSGTGPW